MTAFTTPNSFGENSLWFTYGPSTDNLESLEKILLAGANGCRLTFSYGTCELQQERAMRIKDIASRLNCACIIIADLAGEKIRIGNFQAQKVEIKANDIVTFLAPIGPSNISSREFSVT